MDDEYRKMWADYWALREKFIQKFKDDFPDSEFIQHALNSDFYPSCLEKPKKEPSATTKRQLTENDAETAEEPCVKKRKENTPNEENCALFRPKSTSETENDENAAKISEENDVLDPELKTELVNFDLLIAKNAQNQNADSSSGIFQSKNRRKSRCYTINLPFVEQFTANYSTYERAINMTLKQKVILALGGCNFRHNLRYFTTEGINGKQNTVCEMYFQSFFVAFGGGRDRTMAEESAFKQLTRTMKNYQNGGPWHFSCPPKPIDVDNAQITELEDLLPKLALLGEIITEANFKIPVPNPKALLNEAFRKCKLLIQWKYFSRPNKHFVCDLIAMNKFRLSRGTGRCEMDAACNASAVLLDKIDALLDKRGTRIPSVDLYTRGNDVGSNENPFVSWDKRCQDFQNADILCDFAERNSKELGFQVGSNRAERGRRRSDRN